jgi:hypothetical protein
MVGARDAALMAEPMSWVPAATAGIGAAAALGGQFVAGLFQRRNQELAEKRQRRDQATEVLAEVTALFQDSNPNLLHDADNADEELEAILERRARVRLPLLILATSHPSGRVRELAGRIDFLLITCLRATSVALRAQGDDQRELWVMARGFHGQVSEVLGELVVEVQQS